MLAYMWHLFRFVHHAAERVGTFSLHPRAELRVCAALLPVYYHDRAAEGTNRAHMSDASLKGYALLACDFPVATVDIASEVRERWRFRDRRRGPPASLQLYAASDAALLLSPGAFSA